MENTKKPHKYLAEESLKLTLSDFGRGLLLAQKQTGEEAVGASGMIEIRQGASIPRISYRVALNLSPKRLILQFCPKGGGETRRQSIALSEVVATFGLRPYFLCSCGRQASVLYLPPDQGWFKCRSCANIAYESTRINRQSLNGLLYAVHKLIKLADKRERIKRMYYAGQITKKGEGFMADYNKWQANTASKKEALMAAHHHLA